MISHIGNSLWLLFFVHISLAKALLSSCSEGPSVSSQKPATLYIGGLFSVHRQEINPRNAQTQCTFKNPRMKETFHRFGVEQAEALILATELINGGYSSHGSGNNISLGYDLQDTCGHLHSDCAVELARSLGQSGSLIATIIGPYYSSGSDMTPSSDIKRLFQEMSGTSRKQGIFPFLDEPFLPADFLTAAEFEQLQYKLVYSQQSCVLQARAVIDFLLASGWQEVSVVTSSDYCGQENMRAFEEIVHSRDLQCAIKPKFFQEQPMARILSKTARHAIPIQNTLTARALWEKEIGLLNSPSAIIYLGSIPFALHFFKAYLTLSFQKKKGTFSFLIGDFWGDPSEADGLYQTIVNATKVARSVVALRATTEGVAKFQAHMNSIRANSSEIHRNSYLRRFWENHFHCNVSAGTCNNSSTLPAVSRPILRNHQAVLIIDSVFLIDSYLRTFQKMDADKLLYFSTQHPFFLDPVTSSPTPTNVSSWTGNQVHINISTTENVTWNQPVEWAYDFIVLKDDVSSFYGKWSYRRGNCSFSFVEGNMSVWTPTPIPEFVMCPPMQQNPTIQSSLLTNKPEVLETCQVKSIFYQVCIPVTIGAFHVLLAFLQVFTKGYRYSSLFNATLPVTCTCSVGFAIITIASITVSFLISIKVFDCSSLWLDFVINVISVGCFAAIFIELLTRQVGRQIAKSQCKLAMFVGIAALQTVLSGLASFKFTSMFHKSPLTILSYAIGAFLGVDSAILLWTLHCKDINTSQPYLIGKSKVIAVFASLLASAYSTCIGLLIWSNGCLGDMCILVVIAAFPSAVTLLISVVVTVQKCHTRNSKHLEQPQGQYLQQVVSRYVVEKQESTNSCHVEFFWDDDIVKEINTVLVHPRRIMVGETVGHGNFGEVFEGMLDSERKVALKSIPETMGHKEVNDFVREGLQMRDLRHPNVIELYGLCWSADSADIRHSSPLIILPYMELGDLKNYLRRCRSGRRLSLLAHQPQANAFPAKVSLVQQLKFCQQIAKGMEYISDKGIVHRDLAARNCMLNWDLELKVADFGLARCVKEGKNYYRMDQIYALPIRWMSVESLLDFVFTIKSDVWSFGVVMWEVMTLAMVPYPGETNQEIIPLLKAGRRLSKPELCSSKTFDLMLDCWMTEPEDRPSFSEIVSRLEVFLAELMNYVEPTGKCAVGSCGDNLLVEPHKNFVKLENPELKTTADIGSSITGRYRERQKMNFVNPIFSKVVEV